MTTIVFFAELVALYFLSRWLNQSLFSFFYLTTHSKKVAISFTTFLLFPGTVVHELSHLFVAEILGVKTGKLSLVPEQFEENYIQAGSVQMQQTDPFRRTIIGLAPLFVGLTILSLLSWQLSLLAPQAYSFVASLFIQTTLVPALPFVLCILFSYLLFTISNNMFSSKEDLEGVLPVIILLVIIVVSAYIIGIRVSLDSPVVIEVLKVFKAMTRYISIVLGINLGLLVILRLFISPFTRKNR
jgi:hypothetical protein